MSEAKKNDVKEKKIKLLPILAIALSLLALLLSLCLAYFVIYNPSSPLIQADTSPTMTESEWQAQSVQDIIDLAKINLKIKQNPKTAIFLLKLAQDKTTDESNTLKQSLNNSILELEKLQEINIDFTEIENKLRKLPVKQTNKVLKTQAINEYLDKLITIKRYQNNSAEQDNYLTQYLYLVLEQTRWAVLEKKQIIYEQSLDRMIIWINQYFDLKSEQTRDILTQLETLKTLNVSPHLPEINV